jgi:hypothetical protein
MTAMKIPLREVMTHSSFQVIFHDGGSADFYTPRPFHLQIAVANPTNGISLRVSAAMASDHACADLRAWRYRKQWSPP